MDHSESCAGPCLILFFALGGIFLVQWRYDLFPQRRFPTIFNFSAVLFAHVGYYSPQQSEVGDVFCLLRLVLSSSGNWRIRLFP